MYIQRSDDRRVKFLFLLAAGLLLWALLAVTTIGNLSPGSCSTPLDITAGTEVFWLKTGGRNVQFQLEPDDAGNAIGATVDVYVCTENGNDNTCALLSWDSDGDGLVDSHTLDGGVTPGNRGNQAVGIAGYVKFTATAVTPGKTAQLVVCATGS